MYKLIEELQIQLSRFGLDNYDPNNPKYVYIPKVNDILIKIQEEYKKLDNHNTELLELNVAGNSRYNELSQKVRKNQLVNRFDLVGLTGERIMTITGSLEYSLQDDNKTIKIFVNEKDKYTEEEVTKIARHEYFKEARSRSCPQEDGIENYIADYYEKVGDDEYRNRR